MPTVSRRARATLALWGLSVAVVALASCNWDADSPHPRNIHPFAGGSRTVTYPHSNNGPCYVWGQDNPYQNVPGAYHIGWVGPNPSDTVCGVPLYFNSRLQDLTYTDTLQPIYYLEPVAGSNTTVAASYWKTSRPGVLHLGGLDGTGFAALITDFYKPVKSVTVRFRCAVVPGFRLEARASDGGVLASKDVPTVAGGSDPNYRCGIPAVYSDVTVAAPSITEIIAYGPPNGALNSNELSTGVGAEYWIVPDSTPHLQLTIGGLKQPTYVRDSLRYTASVTDGSNFTITSWKWTADTTPPPGVTETHKVADCNATKPAKPANPCIHTPVTSGTITVYANIGKKADSAKRQLKVIMPRYPVKCGPPVGADTILHIDPSPGAGPVTRGGTVLCNATVYYRPSTLISWKFKPADSTLDSVVAPGVSGVFDWSGTGVTAGLVTVQGTINGIAVMSDTARIDISPRSGWSWVPGSSTGRATAGTFECNTLPHYSTGNYGWTHADSTCADPGTYLWPDPLRHSWTKARVPAGPNQGLWYLLNDRTSMVVRSQVLKDIRPDGSSYSVSGGDTVATSCHSAGINADTTVQAVNYRCMQHLGAFKFDGLYDFAWDHESCHLTLLSRQFATLYDRRKQLETIVRPDTVTLNDAVIFGDNGLYSGNDSLYLASNVIDFPANFYTFWSRNSTNSGWFLRTYQAGGILSQDCLQ